MSAAEAIVVTRWRCPHCRRSWASKTRANEHTATCWLDPANRACKTCRRHHRDHYYMGDHCGVGVDMVDPDDASDPPRTIVQAHCPLWEALC